MRGLGFLTDHGVTLDDRIPRDSCDVVLIWVQAALGRILDATMLPPNASRTLSKVTIMSRIIINSSKRK